VDGKETAISESAKRGFSLFTGKAACVTCHSGWAFTDHHFHDVGLPDADIGRGKVVPEDPLMEHAFKTPSLRNVRQRAPYMHDGSLATIEQVLAHYIMGGEKRASLSMLIHPIELSPDDQKDLIEFLDTLNGADVPTVLPVLPR